VGCNPHFEETLSAGESEFHQSTERSSSDGLWIDVFLMALTGFVLLRERLLVVSLTCRSKEEHADEGDDAEDTFHGVVYS
jgi:hypothetical protein